MFVPTPGLSVRITEKWWRLEVRLLPSSARCWDKYLCTQALLLYYDALLLSVLGPSALCYHSAFIETGAAQGLTLGSLFCNLSRKNQAISPSIHPLPQDHFTVIPQRALALFDSRLQGKCHHLYPSLWTWLLVDPSKQGEMKLSCVGQLRSRC